MKQFITIACICILAACNNKAETPEEAPSNLVIMTAAGKNTAGLNDTLVIYENVCRGCAYENSTQFDIEDSMQLVTLQKIETIDNNPADMDGGTIDKHIYLVPVKTGITKLKLYKLSTQDHTAADSLSFTVYDLEIKK